MTISHTVDDYLAIADSLAEDNNIEASQYLLAFVIFRLVKTMKGNLEPLPELFRLLNKASNALHHGSSKEALCRAVSFAVDESESNGQSITAHKLRQLQTGDRLPVLVQQGESERVEFKSTLRVNLRSGKKDVRIEHAILKTMAAFFNSQGGCLIIGINDAGRPLGLENDEFSSHDKWQQHLVNIVGRDLIGLIPGLWHVSMHRLEGKDAAIVECQKSSKPVFVRAAKREQFFVKDGPTTRELDMSGFFEYCEENFKRS